MLTILIVNYHASGLINQLLATVEMAQIDQVLIVNNSPADAGLSALVDQYPAIVLIQSGENLGFGRACNLGLQQVYQANPTAKVWLLNPDTQLHPGAVAYVLQCLQHQPAAAIVGTRIQDATGTIWFNQGKFYPWLGALPHRAPFSPASQPLLCPSPRLRPSRWVSGCSLVINLAQFAECPQFDPGFFLYYEDNEFCERAYRAGHSIWVTEAVLVTHAVSSLTDRNLAFKWDHATYGKLRFLRRYGRGLAFPLNALYFGVKAAFNWLQGNHDLATGQWRGLKRALGLSSLPPPPAA